ncbi:MAG: SpoIVB peptidase S55 domain-containing protein [Candidatus Aminicenantaceae bacterium]
MRRALGTLFLVFILLNPVFGQVNKTDSFMSLDQVKAGMKGIGKSAFGGKKIEEFNVEILGILHNFQPKKSLILARLNGGILEKAGVISGMSGSPVYVGGKLIGAVAYSIPYAKEAIAGITPISDMLSISEEKETQRSSFSPRIPLKKSLMLEELFEINKDFFSSKISSVSEGQTFLPLSVPLVFSGFPSVVFERAKPFFTKLGFNPIRTGTISQKVETITPPDLTLSEGEPVGIQLVGGDLSLAAIGTVTQVDGKKVLAFGHPLYNLGKVEYAMTKADVITVVPSISSSFKIANTDTLVGKFSQDRTSGIFGEIGKIPETVPLNIIIVGDKRDRKEFKINVVKDKILSPVFVNLALSGALASEERSFGDLSLEIDGNIYLDNGKSVHIEDLYSGNFNTSVDNLSGLIAAVVYLLTNNEFKDLGIHRIDLGIRSSEEVKFCYLERIWLDKYEASPGERIRIKVYSRTFRGKSVLQEVGISVPNLPAGSDFQLYIADASSMYAMEISQYKITGFVPRSLSQLLRILNNLRKNNRIYFKIIADRPGLFLKGEEMPNLPLTMKSMFASPRASATAPVMINRSTLREYQLPVEYVFKGAALIPLKIRE